MNGEIAMAKVNKNSGKNKNKDKRYIAGRFRVEDILFMLIMVTGIFVRIFRFGSLPDGINQDEAFAGYEAYSLLRYGKDSFGYSFPVYLTTWGSGMNVLNSYLMIPFIAIFGLKTWVIRMPQLIVAIFTLMVCYLIMKRLFNERAGLIAMFIMAIVPWHIMLSRWGLESNLAPGFLMFGFYFFIRGMENQKFYIVSALMYGLSLYSYATIWPFVPLIVLLEVIYALYLKKLHFDRYIVISVILLAVLALPLLLFLLVNSGRIDELKLGVISIPKLLYMRSGEISLKNVPENFKNILNIMTNQTDGLITNVYGEYSFLYKITLIFFAYGIIISIINIAKNIKSRQILGQVFLIIQFVGGFLLTLLVYVNINRANSLMIPIIMLAAYGIYDIAERVNFKLIWVIAVCYLCFFVDFSHAYFTSYNEYAGNAFCVGLEEAMDYAEELSEDSNTIYITSYVSQSRVMFYSKIPVDEYINTVVYNNYPGAFIGTDSFGRYCMSFDIYNNIDANGIYILDIGTDSSVLESYGFKPKEFGYYKVLERV